MRKLSDFNELYHDLLTDPDLRPVVQELDSICTAPRLPDSVTWNSIRALYAQDSAQKIVILHPQSPVLHQWWRPLTRKAVLIPVVMTLFLAITAFTFAFAPLLQNLLTHEAFSDAPLSYTIYDNINQSQKIGNTTITLEKGYADANQIILGYTLSPSNTQLAFQYGGLQTQNGTNISSMATMEDKQNSTTTATRITFDTYGLKDPASVLQLVFTASFGLSPMTNPGNENSHIVTFHFTLPFHPGVVVTSGQKSLSHGTIVTLNRVIVTQTETCVVLKGLDFSLPLLQNLSKTSVTLQRVGDAHIYYLDSGYTPTDPPIESSFYFHRDFTHLPGVWTLTIKGNNPTATANDGKAVGYTWVFHFTIPPQ